MAGEGAGRVAWPGRAFTLTSLRSRVHPAARHPSATRGISRGKAIANGGTTSSSIRPTRQWDV